uniref:CTAGE family member 3 n=1 Tax=Castor canadensis TaxID=51338 RepID=A0A8B7TU51_CASCN|nr:putative cTAGE family member 3 [Castor canadensis]
MKHLKDSTTDVFKENAKLQENCKQLLRDTDALKEQVSKLNKQKIKVEESVAHAEQLVNARKITSGLTECLLKMKVWAILEEHMTYSHLQSAMKSGSGNGALLDNQTEESL